MLCILCYYAMLSYILCVNETNFLVEGRIKMNLWTYKLLSWLIFGFLPTDKRSILFVCLEVKKSFGSVCWQTFVDA